MGDILYCLPTDIKTADATLSLTSGTANANFPLTNLADRRPAKAFKATGTSCTIRATFSGSVSLEAVSFGPHNLAGATVAISNNGGLSSTPITIPANLENGLSVNPFKRFGASAATQWDLAISGAAANVAIGELQLIATLRTLDILLGAQEGEKQKSIMPVTDFDAKMGYTFGISQRRLHGTVLVDSSSVLAAVRTLIRSAKGQFKSFVLILDESVNDAMLVDLMTDEEVITWVMPDSALGEIDLDFLEVQRGVAL